MWKLFKRRKADRELSDNNAVLARRKNVYKIAKVAIFCR